MNPCCAKTARARPNEGIAETDGGRYIPRVERRDAHTSVVTRVQAGGTAESRDQPETSQRPDQSAESSRVWHCHCALAEPVARALKPYSCTVYTTETEVRTAGTRDTAAHGTAVSARRGPGRGARGYKVKDLRGHSAQTESPRIDNHATHSQCSGTHTAPTTLHTWSVTVLLYHECLTYTFRPCAICGTVFHMTPCKYRG